MKSLFFRNLIFTILQPGTVIMLFPYLISKPEFERAFQTSFSFVQYVGIFLFIVGWAITLYCIFRFAKEGKGTLSPADPTRHLVIKGIYRYSRNPMYIGVLTAFAGEVIFTTSGRLLIYFIVLFIVFHLFIITIEEPRLKKDFPADYAEYIKRVRRWI